jgi:hypothetical protein
VPGAWLDDEPGRGEQRGELGERLRRPLQVDAPREYQRRLAERGKRGTGGRRVKCPFGSEGKDSELVGLLLSRRRVSLGGGIPAAVEERVDRLPVVVAARTAGDAADASANQGSSWRSFTIWRRISASGSSPADRPLGVIRASLFTLP